MSDNLFKNRPTKWAGRYRIKSTRLENYDYGRDGFYFVTICTDKKQCFFGDVAGGRMVLNQMGKMADVYWQEIPAHFPFVRLDEYVVMPDHVHGVILIDNDVVDNMSVDMTMNVSTDTVETPKTDTVETPKLGVSTNGKKHSNVKNTPTINKKSGGKNPQWKSGVLGVIINQFKRKCTIEIRKTINPNFAWQSRFHDHIIRNEKSLNNIRQYIIDNPEKWSDDRNNMSNIWM